MVRHAQACPKRLLKLIYLKNCWNSKVDFWNPAFRQKGSYKITNISMSVGKHFFSRLAHRIFLKFHMKLQWLKGKKFTESDFLKKIKNKKNKKNPPWKDFFWFKGCTRFGLYGFVKTVCLGKIWFSSYMQKISWPVRSPDF